MTSSNWVRACLPAAVLAVLVCALVAGAPAPAKAADDIPVNLTISNSTDNNVSIYWITHEGGLRFYKSLGARQSYTQPTYAGHQWVAVFNGTGVRRTFIAPAYDATWALR